MNLQPGDTAKIAYAADIPAPPVGSVALGGPVAFTVGVDQVKHIDDPDGRRLFEGWGSLGGIDWQDEEISPAAFVSSAAEYLQKNPVVLWDHKRDMPIGKVLELILNEDGLYVKGEVMKRGGSRTCPLPPGDATNSFLNKADEVWEGMLTGMIRGLSANGKARRRAVWAEELGRYVPQVIQVLLVEISITPAQVHPGARVTALNTVAKAIEICKALDIQQPTPTREIPKMSKLLELQQKLKEELARLGDGAEIPEEFVENQLQISKAIEISEESAPETTVAPPGPAPTDLADQITKAVNAAVAPLQQRVDELSGVKAPIVNQQSHQAPEGAPPKPIDGAGDPNSKISKAIEILETSVDGVANYGKGDFHGVRHESETMKLVLARAQAQAQAEGRKCHVEMGRFDVTPSTQKLLQKIQ